MTPAVFITGAAKRIGKSLALAFSNAGFKIALHYNKSYMEANELAAQLKTPVHLFHADLAKLNESGARLALKLAEEKLAAPIICLINNASLFEPDLSTQIDETLWQQHLDINLKAPILLTQALAYQNKDLNRNVIMMTDEKVLSPTPSFFSYTVSKLALWDTTKLLSSALAPNIRVNAIAPNMVLPNKHQTVAQFAKSAAATPLKRATTLDEITKAALFLCNHKTITGQQLILDEKQNYEEQNFDFKT